jgi:Winged helix DNA-binding domain
MDTGKLRAWWAHRQGLDGSLGTATPAEVLTRTGWARSVGGANPYLQLFGRAGIDRETADRAMNELAIHELPSARGCTYVLPASDYALGLTVGVNGPRGEVATVEKLGVSRAEIEKLEAAVLDALANGARDPRELRDLLGDAVRDLGEPGRKKGVSSTLRVALGLLQAAGEIRRVPVDGRFDRQRYSYVRWSPVGASPTVEEARTEPARRYWTWTGGASLAQFRWFSAFSAKDAKAAVQPLGLVALDSSLLALPEDAAAYAEFVPPAEPRYSLLGWIDGLVLLRRDLASVADEADMVRIRSAFGLRNLTDLPSQAIVDRGRLAGLWDYDAAAGEIVWTVFGAADAALRSEIERTEALVRDQLGDVRGSSLDAPDKRTARLDAIRSLRA